MSNMDSCVRLVKSLRLALGIALAATALWVADAGAEPVLSFNGTSAYVDMGDDPFSGLTGLTVEAWIKTSVVPPAGKYYGIVGQGYLQSSAYGFGLGMNYNARLMFQIRNGSTSYSPALTYPFDDQWHHVAGSYENGTAKIYGASGFVGGFFIEREAG